MDKEQICAELDGVRNDYRELLDTATVAELRKPTDGTKWNNEQLLFHMLFGYLLVRNLRLLVWGFSRLSDSASMRFAALLNAGTRPFHVINYVGSLFGARATGEGGHLMITSHRQHVSDRSLVQPRTELGVAAVDLVAGHPRRRDATIECPGDHLPCERGTTCANVMSSGTPAAQHVSGSAVHDFARYRARSMNACPAMAA
jgi:hypothetical protein